MAQEPLAAFLNSGPLKLLPDDAAGRQAGSFGGLGKPSRQLGVETNCELLAHTA
jgi:hypothetical protein